MKGNNTLIVIMIFSITALFILFANNGFAQAAAGNKKFGKVIDNFFQLYNSGDTAAYRKFLEPVANNQAELNQVLTGFNNAWRVIGKVNIIRVNVVAPDIAEVWVQDNKYDAWWKFSIYTDSLEHFKRRTIQPVPFDSYFIKSGALTDKEVSDAVDQYITSKLSSEFAGNVFIAKENQVIYSKSFGKNQNNQPNTFEQQFDLASMGKMFTAISILQLKDEGKLALEDKVEKFLPTLKNKAVSQVTISQLLTHTSGMGEFFFTPLWEKLKDSLHTAKDYLPLIEAEHLSFEPGKGWDYSNLGFCVLAIIIEEASGEKFENYINQHIFSVASMNRSIVGGGAGGGMSTVTDLQHFSDALLGNQLLRKETTADLFHYTINDRYGYGTEHQLLGNEHIVGHSGGFENVCVELNLYTNTKYRVIILSNSNPPFGHFLSNKIKELLVRK
jgi:D-alanyl-D-alanine carboxypeptidase